MEKTITPEHNILFCALALLLPVVGFFAPRSAAPLVSLIGVAYLILYRRRLDLSFIKEPLSLYMLLVGTYVIIGVSWSLDPDIAFTRWMKVTLMMVVTMPFLLSATKLNMTAGSILEKCMFAGIVLAVLSLVFHLCYSGGFYRLLKPTETHWDMLDAANRAVVTLSLLFSAFFVLTRRRMPNGTHWFVVIIFLVLIAFTRSESALLGGIAWLGAYASASYAPAVFSRLVAWGGITLIMAGPIVILLVEYLFGGATIPVRLGSADARMEIWYAVSNKILEAPILGHGMEASRSIVEWPYTFQRYIGPHIMHPHNGILQIWLDLGFLGALAGSVGWWWLVRGSSRFSDVDRPAVIAGLVLFLTVLSVSHGLWQSWWIAAVLGSVTLTLLVAKPKQR